jgi:hypothetical protein
MKNSLFCLAALTAVCFAASPATAASPLDAARAFTEHYNVSLHGPIRCYQQVDGAWVDMYSRSDAETLVRLVERKRIFLFIHGFYWTLDPFPDTGTPTFKYVLSLWKDHFSFVRSIDKEAVSCIVTLDSTDGFGANETSLGDFLTALRWLTDSPAFYSPDREVVVVGHSAGGNFSKQALLRLRRNWSRIPASIPEDYRTTRMSFVFLGVPHLGTSLVDLLRQVAVLWGEIQAPAAYSEARQPLETVYQRIKREVEEKRIAERRRIIQSRGGEQLRDGNSGLKKLNAEFLSLLDEQTYIYNLFSPADLVAGAYTSSLNALGASPAPTARVHEASLPGLGHSAFLQWQTLMAHRALFQRIYGN